METVFIEETELTERSLRRLAASKGVTATRDEGWWRYNGVSLTDDEFWSVMNTL